MTWATIDQRLATVEAQVRGMLAPVRARLTPGQIAAAIGIELDDWQEHFLAAAWAEAILNCGRQTGKSTAASIVAVDELIHRPGSKVLILGPSERQSGFIFETTMEIYRGLGHVDGVVSADVENKLLLELRNGSKCSAVPAKPKTIRGFAGITLLIIDEGAQIPDELYHAVRPMIVAVGGRLLTLSTPFGKRGWWYEAWEHGGPDWHRVFVPATRSPRYTAERLERERRRVPDLIFRSEYLCQFTDMQDQLI
jgi:hypothetical protein